MIEHYLELLKPLGIKSPAVRFDLPERADDARMADEFLRTSGLAARRFAMLNPGGGLAVEDLAGGAVRRTGPASGEGTRRGERGGVGRAERIAARASGSSRRAAATPDWRRRPA